MATSLVGVLAAGAASAAPDKANIAIVVRDFSNPYWQALRDGAIAEGKKLGVPVTVQAGSNETDTVGQNNKISTMANQPFNCYGVVPVNGTNVITPLLPISRRGTPIINLDTALDEKAVKQSGLKLAAFIGSDNREAGRIAARHMLDALDGKGQVAILEGIPGEQNGINRETAFRNTVKGKLDIVQATPADYQRNKALTKTEAMLRAHPDITGIFAANDLMGLGAARAVLNAGKKGKVTVVSVDGVTEAIKAVKNGTLDATISQYPYAEGQMAVQACLKLVQGKPVPDDITSPIKLITSDNAAAALKAFPKPFFDFKDPFGTP
ncbi:sugar ABC transporter substrate-binding protein [Salinisphaera sp. Q1T1-3]|nr:sugar ABC transporter substrate-binding protein [Salinisphaera sp. Q1T1-3]